MLVDRFQQSFAERAQVRAAVRGVLAVDEGKKRLSVAAVGVGETEFQRLARIMQRRINRLAVVRLQVLHNEIEQTVARLKSLAVIDQPQAGVEVAVVTETPLDMLGSKLDFLEYLRVRLKSDERAVGLIGRFAFLLAFDPALLEPRLDAFTAAMAAHQEFLRKRIHRFGADAVEADAEL